MSTHGSRGLQAAMRKQYLDSSKLLSFGISFQGHLFKMFEMTGFEFGIAMIKRIFVSSFTCSTPTNISSASSFSLSLCRILYSFLVVLALAFSHMTRKDLPFYNCFLLEEVPSTSSAFFL